MARKKRRLCWDDVADIWSGNLLAWGAFQPDLCETIELTGTGLKEGELASFIMDSDGKAFTHGYVPSGPSTLTFAAGRIFALAVRHGIMPAIYRKKQTGIRAIANSW